MLPLYIIEMDDQDDQAFIERIYSKYREYFYYLILKQVGEQDAEDVLHEAFYEMVRRVSLLRRLPKVKLHAYLVNIVRSRAANAREKRNYIQRYTQGEEELKTQAAEDDSPEEWMMKRVSYEEAGALLEQVEEQYRTVFVLKHFLFLEDQEIAGLVGISAQSVRVYVSRARQRLLALLQEREEQNEQSFRRS